MKRQHPLLSSLGFILTAIMLAGLGLMILRSGGMAFSPGQLSGKTVAGINLSGFASHAEFESRCELCHAPLQTTQDVLCEKCHADVRNQISSESGIHGKISQANRCARCHSDHKGPQFDPGRSSWAFFDHSNTQFSLAWHQVDYDATLLECAACHNADAKFSAPDQKCSTCHARHDQKFMLQHVQDFGENCIACHDGLDRMVKFDHSKTKFPLKGKHAELQCVQCHGVGKWLVGSVQTASQLTAQSFKQAPTDCAGCHAEPEAHKGLFDSNCASCHSTDSWKPARMEGKLFDHASTTGFSLALHAKNYDGSVMTCKDCHQNGVEKFDLQVCETCHAQGAQRATFMRKHVDQFGAACLDCHDGVDRMSDFNHANFFVLDGKHANIECDACHKNKVFKDTPKVCVQCHADPAIHAGFFGLKCEYCHSTEAWSPAALIEHSFPLGHGDNGEVACQTCHPSKYAEYTCYGCHDHQPDKIKASHQKAGISAQDLPDCAKCHATGLKFEDPKSLSVPSQMSLAVFRDVIIPLFVTR
jgi:hypothetical protein